jgi:hypothetical protein
MLDKVRQFVYFFRANCSGGNARQYLPLRGARLWAMLLNNLMAKVFSIPSSYQALGCEPMKAFPN